MAEIIFQATVKKDLSFIIEQIVLQNWRDQSQIYVRLTDHGGLDTFKVIIRFRGNRYLLHNLFHDFI